jgi:hypothetical protein
MKNSFITVAIFVLASSAIQAQTTATDFNRKDCNGVQRHLFADLDSGNAVIIEFFMINCAPCPVAGQLLESLKTNLLTQYPGKVISYAIAYNNTYSQAQVKNWVSTNGFSTIPMDSGAYQVAYYGGMGMPTIVVLAGKNTHSVLGTPYIGFNTSDTTQVGADIRNYLKSTTTNTNITSLLETNTVLSMDVYPNPARSEISVSLKLKNNEPVKISLYDLQGRLVKVLYERPATTGYKQTIDISGISAGNYILRCVSGTEKREEKITITN